MQLWYRECGGTQCDRRRAQWRSASQFGSTPSTNAVSDAAPAGATPSRCQCCVEQTTRPHGVQPPNSRRADNALGANDPIAYYYALTDAQLAADCQMEYKRLDGRVIAWNTGDSLQRFADTAAGELGLGAQQTVALAAWMTRFQLRPVRGGAVLSARVGSGAQGEPIPQALRQAEARDCEHVADGQLRY